MAKPKKNKNKAKLNLTVREEQRNKLEQMASLENRSVSNLIEVMADERWKRLVEASGKKDHGNMADENFVRELYRHMEEDDLDTSIELSSGT